MPRTRAATVVAHADGDTVYLQMLRDVTGWGLAGTIIQVVQTPYVDAMVANGFAVIVTSPSLTPTPETPTSIQWQPYTLYPAGWEVFAPNGQFVRRNTTGVSGAAFDSSQWTVVNDVGAGGIRTIDGELPDGSGNVDLSGVYVTWDGTELSQGGTPIPVGSGSVAFGTDPDGFDTITAAAGSFGTDGSGFDTITI